MIANPAGARLRVGILMESLDVSAWQFALLESILNSDSAEIALLITSGRAPEPATRRLYRIFQRFEDKNREKGPDACVRTSAESLLRSVDRLEFDPASTESIDARQLDVLLALVGPDALPSNGSLARLGVWYFDSEGRAFSPASGAMIGFRELLSRRPHFESALRILLPGAPVTCAAYQTWSAIDYLSHWRTRNEHLWKCSTFAARALTKCHETGGGKYLESIATNASKPSEATGSTSEALRGVATFFKFLSYVLWRVVRKIHQRFYRERWILMFSIDGRKPWVGKFKKLVPPTGRFWADPHVVEVDGRHHVFFEDASQKTGIAHLSLISDKGDGDFTSPKEVLRRPYHLSYPFVFKWQGTYFLIPESAENRTVELYRCARFPDRWTFEHNLMEDISAYDATLVEHGGLWWLFASVREPAGASSWDELCIYFADNPLSRNWRPHRRNPVISDVRRARPAGRLFFQDGRLIRPSQDSSRRYGRALHLNEVIELNEHLYREITVETIIPDRRQSIQAVHSYSRAGKLAFVDAIHRESRLSKPEQ